MRLLRELGSLRECGVDLLLRSGEGSITTVFSLNAMIAIS